MTAIQFFLQMLPFYILGCSVLLATYKSEYRSLLKVDFKVIGKFLLLMAGVTAARIFLGEQDKAASKAILDMLPWQTTCLVFWEDSVHTLPLAIFALKFQAGKFIKYLYYPLMIATMIAFGSGHTYQGLTSAILLSLYIPFGVRLGRKYGFGSIMVCHVLYDLITMATVKFLIG